MNVAYGACIQPVADFRTMFRGNRLISAQVGILINLPCWSHRGGTGCGVFLRTACPSSSLTSEVVPNDHSEMRACINAGLGLDERATAKLHAAQDIQTRVKVKVIKVDVSAFATRSTFEVLVAERKARAS